LIKDGERENIPVDCPPEFSQIIQQCWETPEKRPSIDILLTNLLNGRPHQNNNSLSKSNPSEVKCWYFDPATERKTIPHKIEEEKKKYLLLDATDKDKQFVVNLYQQYPVEGYEIGNVQVIYNRTFNIIFNAHLETLQQRANNPAFAPKWTSLSYPSFRQKNISDV